MKQYYMYINNQVNQNLKAILKDHIWQRVYMFSVRKMYKKTQNGVIIHALFHGLDKNTLQYKVYSSIHLPCARTFVNGQ